MAKLFRRVQLGSALETVTASKPASLETTQANYDTAPLDLDFAPDIESFDREFARTSISRVKGTQGQKAVGINFRTELVGTTLGTFAAGAPGWAKWLVAAGFRQEAHATLTVLGTITGGPFRHGEIVGDAVNTATVIHDTHNGDTTMYLYGATGAIATTGTLTGESSGATAALTSTVYAASQGWSWWPISEPVKEVVVTGTLAGGTVAGNVLEGATSGARIVFKSESPTTQLNFTPIRGTLNASELLNDLTTALSSGLTTAGSESFTYGGTIAAYANLDGTGVVMLGARANASIVFEVNRQVFLAIESRGFFDSVSDLPLLASDSISSATPPLWQNADTYFADNEDRTGTAEDRSAEIIPCLTGLELNSGGQFGDRRCASATSGLEEVIIQQRQGTASVKTEATFEADVDFLGKLLSGVVMRTRTTIGTAAGNQFYVTAPGLQYESAGQENANGLRVYNMGAKLTGGAINNLSGATVALSGIGGDNEVVLSYVAIP